MKAYRKMIVDLNEEELVIKFSRLKEADSDDLKRVKLNIRFLEKSFRRCDIKYKKTGSIKDGIILSIDTAKYPSRMWVDMSPCSRFQISNREVGPHKSYVDVGINDEREMFLIY